MNTHKRDSFEKLIAGGGLFLLVCGVVAAQDASPNIGTAELQLESITLKDGTIYKGLLQSKARDDIEFVEIFRRPGMPMSATVRVVDPGQIKQYVPLSTAGRRVLEEHVHRLRHRVAIEAGDQQRVAIVAASAKGPYAWEYSGPWFQLTSTADEESTRRCIVRIEQIFRAYRQLIPTTVVRPRPLRIVLYGSVDEYQTALRTLGIEIENLAFYASREQTIFAGAELASYSQRLQSIRAAHQNTLRDLDADAGRFRAQLKAFSEKLAKEGFGREQIKEEMGRRNAAWNRERLLLERQISETDRRNEAAFAKVTDRMFRRLYHEAFHAYLADYVVPDRAVRVDRWLNEGLAQIFEVGQLDGDTLRIDAPNIASLAQLQRDLASTNSLALMDVLVSNDQDFLAAHSRIATARRYAYAWGLAYYLTIEKQLLTPESLATFLSSSDRSELNRFEALIGKPLGEFEHEWRDAMRNLSPRL
jgi:Skp family chaperone for outer membrane proteins